MRAAGIAVPESEKELLGLIQEAERDPREIPLDEAFRQVRARLKARRRQKGA